jgi:hypothetical protein
MRWGWWGADPAAAGADTDGYELGTRFQVNGPCVITGIRIRSAGTAARTGRNGKLWSTDSAYANQVQVSTVDLPATMPALEWVYAFFETPAVTKGGLTYFVVSYDTGNSAGNGDYCATSAAFNAAVDSPDKVIQFPIGAGRFTATNGQDVYPVGIFSNAYYAVDVIYNVAESARTIFDFILPDPILAPQNHIYTPDPQRLRLNPGRILLARGGTAATEATLALTQAVETDTGLALVLTEEVTEGQASETDTGLAVVTTKLATVGLPSETDTGLPLSETEAATVGLASETDTGLPLVLTKVVELGLSVETDTGLPLAQAGTVTLGLAVETDTALTLANAEANTFSQAEEVDTAFALTATSVVTLGIATETDTGLPFETATSVAVVPTQQPGGAGVGSELTGEAAILADDEEVLCLM